MGRINSRRKGRVGENEVIGMLQPIVDKVCKECGKVRFELMRDQRQRFQPKLYDIVGIPWLALEVKRVENQSGINGWWKQTLDATKEGQVPVLLYRQNNRPWMVRTRVSLRVRKGVSVKCTVTMSFAQWAVWFEQKLSAELSGSR